MKQNIKDWFVYFLLAWVLMTVGSMTSWLFPLHTGVDQNCFLSVAKAWTEGRIPYLDLHEQKGPLLYFLHIPAALFPQLRFFGVYLVQVAVWTVLLRMIGNLATWYLPKRWRYRVAAVSGLVIVMAFCYSRGDNAEEFCLIPVLWSLCDLLAVATDRKPCTNALLCKTGVLAGCVLWIKYTMLGFYIGWCLLIGIWIWKTKGFGAAWKAGSMFLLGMALATLPWSIYFASQGALSEWLTVYLVDNATRYPRSITVGQRIADFFGKDLLWNPVMMAFVLLGTIVFARSERFSPTKFSRLAVPVTLVLLYCFVFIGGVRYRYYLLILGAFVPLGAIAAADWLERRWQEKLFSRTAAVIFGSCWGLILGIAGNCLYFIGKPNSYYPQIQFAEQMPDGATLLNYNFLDGGFFLMNESPLPESRFFCKLNIARTQLPEMYEAQERMIREQETEYVVIRWEFEEQMREKNPYPELYAQYDIIDYAVEYHDEYCYALLKKHT